MKVTLTNKLYLRAVVTLTATNGGVPPTCAEIGQYLGVTPQGAESHVSRLKAAGLLTNSRQHRSLRLTEAGAAALANSPGVSAEVMP